MIVSIALASLSGCCGAARFGTPAHAQTTLEFPTWQAEEPGVSTWWKDLIAAYEKRYPDVKVNLQQVPFAQFVKQMTVRFAAGNAAGHRAPAVARFRELRRPGLARAARRSAQGHRHSGELAAAAVGHAVGGKTQGVLLMGYGGMLFYNEQEAEGREARRCRRRPTNGSRR